MYTRYSKNFLNTYPFSNVNMTAQLAAATALSFTIPGVSTQVFRAKFRSSFTDDVWVSYNGTAVVPTAATASQLAYQEMVPLDEARYVKGGDTLSFISSTGTPQVSVSLLLLQDTTVG